MKAKDLRPNPKNPRIITDAKLSQLKKSMEYFGDISGIVFNRRSGNLGGGHQRARNLDESAKVVLTKKFDKPSRTGTVAVGYIEQDGERFNYREVDWPEHKEKAANIAANNGAGQWDVPQLTEWLKELGSFDVDFDMDLTMFDDEELADFGIEDVTVSEYTRTGPTGIDEDEIPEKAPARTKVGDVYQLGQHRLLCGDCTSEKAVEKLFEGKRAELSFTSPPYSDQRDYGGGLKLDPAHLAQFLRAPAKIFAVNLGLQKRDHEIVPYWQAYIDFAHSIGLKLLSWNVWDKQQCGSVGHQTMMFPLEHEWIFVFGKAPRILNKTEDTIWGGIGKSGATRNKDGSLSTRSDTIVGMKKPISTVLRHYPEKARNFDFDHPAMFPVGFPEKYVAAATDEGDIVFEPFCGSGSALIACEKTARRCFAMEIDPSYCDIIVERWEKYTGAKAKLLNAPPKTILRKKKTVKQSLNSHA